MVSSSLASVAPVDFNRIPLKSPSKEFDPQPPAPKGLKNVGNSCYANAALQCLLSTALSHALLDPRNTVIFRRYSSNHNLLIAGSGSVDSQDDCMENGHDDSDMCSSSGATEDFPNQSRKEQRRKAKEEKTKEKMKEKKKALARETCKWLSGELTDITRQYTAFSSSSPPEPPSDQNSSWSSFFFPPSSNPDSASDNVVDPGSITRHVSKLCPTLKPYEQEDAHEFIRALLSTLTLDGFNRKLSSLFDGLLESAVTCQTCRHASMTRDRYMDLSLDIASKSVVDLHSALKHFTKTEYLDADNMVHCIKCRTKRTVSKGLRLATAPTILVCHLKRFAYDCYGRITRLNDFIKYPLRLEIGEYMSRANRGTPPPYELVGVLVHSGYSCNRGHYVAYVKSGKQWFQANDDVITPVDLHTVVLKQKAYILIYEVAGMRTKHGLENFSHYHHGKTPTPSPQPVEIPGIAQNSHSRSWDPELDESTSLSFENDTNNNSSRDLLRHTRHNMYDLSLSPCPSPTPSQDEDVSKTESENEDVSKTESENEDVSKTESENEDVVKDETIHHVQPDQPPATVDVSPRVNSSSKKDNAKVKAPINAPVPAASTLFNLLNACGLSHTFDSLFGEESHCCPNRSNSKDIDNNTILENDTSTTCTIDEEQNSYTRKSQTHSSVSSTKENNSTFRRPQKALSADDKLQTYYNIDDEDSITEEDIIIKPKIKPNCIDEKTSRQRKYKKQHIEIVSERKLQEPLELEPPPMRRSNTSSDLIETEIQAARAYQEDERSSSRSKTSLYSPPRRFTKNISTRVNRPQYRNNSFSPSSRAISAYLPASPQSPKTIKEILCDYGGKKKLRQRSRSREPTKRNNQNKNFSFTPRRPPLSSPYTNSKPLRSKSAGPMRPMRR